MKRAAIALLLLLLTAAVCTFTLKKFETAISQVICFAVGMADAIENEDAAAAQKSLDRLAASWRQHQDLFRILSGTEPCGQLDRSLEQVKVWFRQKEKSPETLSELYDLIKAAEDLRETQSPRIINLF